MSFYWDGLIAALVEALAPASTMHFGAGAASAVPALACALAENGRMLHVVTRQPEIDQPALRAACGDHLVVHTTTGPNAIELMPVPDLAIIDGDPNFFTVHGILTALHARAAATGRPLPVILVAQTGFPYARRDGYDDPASIPAEFRFPHERAGIVPGQAELAGSMGLHADRYNATVVNEPRSGVQTAVEAFSNVCALSVWSWPYAGGLTLLVARDAAQSSRIGQLAYDHALAPGARRMAEAAEAARIEAALASIAARHAEHRAQAHIAALSAALKAERQAAAGLRHSAAQTAQPGKPAAPPPGFFSPPTMTDLMSRKTAATPAAPVAAEAASSALLADPDDVAALAASPLFDDAWYVAAYPDVAQAGHDPAVHYLAVGAAEGRNPSPHFSSAYYLASNADVAAAGLNPLLHYLRGGATEDRDPSPDFSSRLYLEANGDVSEAGLNPLEHYVRHGRAEGRVAPAPVRG